MQGNCLINTPQRGVGTRGEPLNRFSGFHVVAELYGASKTGEAGGRDPKPRRGGLFIGADTPPDSSFCFSAARTRSKCSDPVRTVMGPARLDMAVVAPPKNKKKKWVVSALAINRPPLRGLGDCTGSKTYRDLSKLRVMTSAEPRC